MQLSDTQDKAWQAFIKACPGKSLNEFLDRYQGTYDDKRSFAYSHLIFSEHIPAKIAQFIDFDRYIAMIESQNILFLEDGPAIVHVFTK